MIKSVRSMTKLLGKLGVRCLVKDADPYWVNLGVPYAYGIGLKVAKDFTERFLDREAATAAAAASRVGVIEGESDPVKTV